MPDPSLDPRSDDTGSADAASVHEADVRNGEPDALDSGGQQHPDDDPDQRLQPDEHIDVTEPTDDGEPIHQVEGGDIGDGAD